jgi:hypothetical protein
MINYDTLLENYDKLLNNKYKKYKKYKKSNINKICIFPKVNRIIVIGDIHGDYNLMIKLLKTANLIDDNNNWIGNDTYVVQVGDQIDNCRPINGELCRNQIIENDIDKDYEILLFFTKLHFQASKYGGAVISLMGNHELMNVNGNFQYVSRAGLGYNSNTFKSIEDRKKKFSRGKKISIFMAYTRYVAVIIGSNLFSHAGILSDIANKYTIDDINKIMKLYLLNKIQDENIYNDILYNEKISPLWNRVYGNMGYYYDNNNLSLYNNENDIINTCSMHMRTLYEKYKINRIYIGHTPMLKNGIRGICNNKIWLTDYGGSKAFNFFKNNGGIEDQVLEVLNDGENINILKYNKINNNNTTNILKNNNILEKKNINGINIIDKKIINIKLNNLQFI